MFRTNFFLKGFTKKASTCYLSSQTIFRVLKSGKAGDTIKVQGWVKSLRDQKENVFFDISDGSTNKKLQVIISKKCKPENLNPGASIIASGPLSLSPKGQIELSATNVEISGRCVVTEGYPFAPRKQYTPEYVRQYLHFRPRTNAFAALLRVRNAATLAIHNHFNKEGFINVHTPILTSNDCEGAGETFKVLPENRHLIKVMGKPKQSEDEIYFNNKAFLTVSGQLHLEAAVYGLSKVYTFGPTFRAENSRSRLHLSEFYMLEAEIAFTEQLQDVIDCIEKLVKEVTKTLLDQSFDDISCCQGQNKDLFDWINKKFPVLTYEETVEILNSNRDKFNERFEASRGLGKEHELFIVKHCGNIPVFVINWPKEMKPFYMKECGNGNVAALDLLGPNVGEVVGGSLREEDYEKLKNQIGTNHQLSWYLDLRKFGAVPTGGFGLGFERYLQLILGIANIKDVIPFPRWPHNCNL